MMALPFSTFVESLQHWAGERPEQQAFVFLDNRGAPVAERTFATLDSRARAIATKLHERKLAGKPVLLVFPPSLDFIDALLGCFYAGCIAVPAPYGAGRRSADRIDSIRNDCGATVALSLAGIHGGGAPRPGRNEHAHLEWIWTDLSSAKSSHSFRPVSDPQALALLQYTSGSTSAPKGVMLSHANLIANSDMIRAAFGNDSNLRGVGWLPLFHDMGLIGHVLQPIYLGGFSALMSPLTFLQRPVRWLQAISDWRATTSGGPTYAYDLCVQKVRSDQMEALDLSSWRVAYCGSEKIRATSLDEFGRKFANKGFRSKAFTPCYGLAEATLMVSSANPGQEVKTAAAHRPETTAQPRTLGPPPVVSCGHPWGAQAVAVVDPHSRRKVRDGIVGEIWVTGPNVGRGYWLQPELSDDVFAARIGNEIETYLRTGDLGFMRDGELFIVGRIKDTIIVRGVNFAAEDMEATISASDAAFRAMPAAAFGIETAGAEHIVVVQEVDRSRLASADISKAVATAFEHLNREHGIRLHDFLLVRAGTLPRTSSGKVQRHRCRTLYEAGQIDRLNSTKDLPWLGVNRRSEAHELVE